MKDFRFSLRNAAVVIGCLAASMLFSACNKGSSEKVIIDFRFVAQSAIGKINETSKTIAVDVPYGTDVTELIPLIEVSEKAKVNPASGAKQDFTNSVVYTVTAENGSQVEYTVTVTVGGSTGTELTDAMINAGDKVLEAGIYLVTEWLTLRSPNKLTLSPGVTIKFANAAHLDVNENATLIAKGTATSPILFTSAKSTPQAGDWGYVELKGNGSQLEYCTFEYGGGNAYGMVYATCNLTIKNCTFKNSKYAGLNLAEAASLTAFTDNQFNNCANSSDIADHPMQAERFNSLQNFGNGNAFANSVANKGVLIKNANSSYLNKDVTLKKINVPYYLDGDTRISADAPTTLTIEAGVEIKMMKFAAIKVQRNGKLAAEGTSAAPIRITGVLDQKGYWDYISIEDNASAGTILDNCEIINGGTADKGAIYLDETRTEQATIKNCRIDKSLGYGIFFSPNADAVLENNTFGTNCDKGGSNK